MSEREFREIGVSDARANMTEVIAEARLLDVDFVLTRRDKPQAVLISVKRYEQAIRDRAIIDELHRRTDDPGDGAKGHDKATAKAIRDALHSAALAVDD